MISLIIDLLVILLDLLIFGLCFLLYPVVYLYILMKEAARKWKENFWK